MHENCVCNAINENTNLRPTSHNSSAFATRMYETCVCNAINENSNLLLNSPTNRLRLQRGCMKLAFVTQ
ncbi:MAG: hypothetical protein KA450_13535, partial [Bacteroidia bacterium]|nr:hypothetical protein [Bacteroidia bacterium]